MLCNMTLIEVEIFKRIVNLGYPAIPKVLFYKVLDPEHNKSIGECDIVILNPKNITKVKMISY